MPSVPPTPGSAPEDNMVCGLYLEVPLILKNRVRFGFTPNIATNTTVYY